MNNIIKVSGGEGILNKVKKFFSVLVHNNVAISHTSDIIEMPIILFLVIALLGIKFSVFVILISLFCGVEYKFRGQDFITERKITFRPQK